MNQRLRLAPAVLFLLLSPVLGFGQSKELTRIRVSYSSIGAASLSTWVAVDAGIFNKHGLDVGLIYIGGGPRSPNGARSFWKG